MSVGKVDITKLVVWHPKISLNDGQYVIRPFECKIIGKADGCESEGKHPYTPNHL